MAAPPADAGAAQQPSVAFRAIVREWAKDHRMFVATLEELGSQLAELEPPAPAAPDAEANKDGSAELLQRLLKEAPSERLRAYVEGERPGGRLRYGLADQLDQNLQLVDVLAAEMRGLLGQLEQLADDAAAALAQVDEGSAAGEGNEGGAVAEGDEGSAAGQDDEDADEPLLMAAVLDGVARETELIEKAADGITLTTPADEVSAAATVLQLEPFLNTTLLDALLDEPGAA